MPNGYPYFLNGKADYCERCGQPLCEHDKERETHANGWSYNYLCPSGAPAITPQSRGGA